MLGVRGRLKRRNREDTDHSYVCTRKEAHSSATSKAVDVVVAEYTALRAEITTRLTIQATLVGTGLTVSGVVLGLALGKDGNQQLLILVPALAAVTILLVAEQTAKVAAVGRYIRTTQADYMRRSLADSGLPSWEKSIADRRRRVSLFDATIDGVFVSASAASVIMLKLNVWLGIGLVVPSLLTTYIHLRIGWTRD